MFCSVHECEMDKKLKLLNKQMTTVTTMVICSCTCNAQNTEMRYIVHITNRVRH